MKNLRTDLSRRLGYVEDDVYPPHGGILLLQQVSDQLGRTYNCSSQVLVHGRAVIDVGGVKRVFRRVMVWNMNSGACLFVHDAAERPLPQHKLFKALQRRAHVQGKLSKPIPLSSIDGHAGNALIRLAHGLVPSARMINGITDKRHRSLRKALMVVAFSDPEFRRHRGECRRTRVLS